MASEIKITAAGETMIWVTSQADTSSAVVNVRPAIPRKSFAVAGHFALLHLASCGDQIALWGADIVTVERIAP